MTGTTRPLWDASRRAAVWMIAATFTLPAVVQAQDLTLVPAEDRAATMRLVSARENSAIEADLDAARDLSNWLESEVERLRLDLAEAEAAVDVKESEIDVIKTRKDLADKRDEEAEKKAFEEQQKDEELQKRLLERHVELVKRQIDLTRAQRETAQSAERVYREELKLESVAADLAELQGTAEGNLGQAMRLQEEFNKIEKDVLEAQRDHARKKEDEAKRERRVIEGRLDIVEARNRILTS